MFDAAIQAFGKIHQQFGPLLDTGLLIFARSMAFVAVGPVFNRKNMPVILKVVMAMFLTTTLLWMVPVPKDLPATHTLGGEYLIQLIMNVTIGAILGFSANLLLLTLSSAGSVFNNQIGLSSAMLLDPSTGTQTMVMEPLFNLVGVLLFIHLGGLHWMINALKRSCVSFPVYTIQHSPEELFNLNYLVQLSGDTVTVAVQLIAPVMVVTIAVDMILGIVNRTAQQMPVFQLSFALKPAIGIAVILLTLPVLISGMAHFLSDHAALF